MSQVTFYNGSSLPIRDPPVYSSSRSAVGMGANGYRQVAAAPFGGNSAHFDLWPSQAHGNRISSHLLPSVGHSISDGQAPLVKNGSSRAGCSGLNGMCLSDGPSVSVPSAHPAGYSPAGNAFTRYPPAWPEWDPGGPVRGGGGDQVAGTASGQSGAIGPGWYPLDGPPDQARPWMQGSPRWSASGHNPSLRLMVPEAAIPREVSSL